MAFVRAGIFSDIKAAFRPRIKQIAVVLLICAAVYFWGRYRTVDVEMVFHPETVSGEAVKMVDVTVLERDGGVAAVLKFPVEAGQLPVRRISLRPGVYQIRGAVNDAAGRARYVEQGIVVPADDATIDLYLRGR